MNLQDKIKHFKSDLREMDAEELFQKHLIDSESYFFSAINKSAREFEIKQIISRAFSVSVRDVVIVGSGQLGFSLKPDNLFNPFDHKFRITNNIKDKSDLDIAIISSNAFSSIVKRAFEFTDSFKRKWDCNEYYLAGKNREIFNVDTNHKFFEYIAKGWIRPDYKPSGLEICSKGNTYEKLRNNIANKTAGRKLSIGLYSEWYYFKDYHIGNIKKLASNSKTDII